MHLPLARLRLLHGLDVRDAHHGAGDLPLLVVERAAIDLDPERRSVAPNVAALQSRTCLAMQHASEWIFLRLDLSAVFVKGGPFAVGFRILRVADRMA